MKNKLEKALSDYLRLPYTIELRRDDEGDFIARIKELDGCVADGQDEMEALGNLEVAKQLWLAAAVRSGQAIPLPAEDDELPSGKFLTRVPRSLHKKLNDLAKREGVSLNHLVAVSLSQSVGEKAMRRDDVRPAESVVPRLDATGTYGGSCATGALRLVASYGVRAPRADPADEALSMEFAASKVPRDQKITRPQSLHHEEGGLAVGY